MKILFYRYKSICEPDILDAFIELGHTVTEFWHDQGIDDMMSNTSSAIRSLSSFLLDHPQDAVFSINFFPHVSDVCNIFHLRYLSWIVDAPVLELFTAQIQHPYNRVFIFDRALYEDVRQYNEANIFHFPLGAAVTKKSALIHKVEKDIGTQFACDISFVGSLYTEKSPYDKLTGMSDYTLGFLDGIMKAQKNIYGYYFIDELLTDQLIQEFKEHIPAYYQNPYKNFMNDRYIISQLYIGHKITSMERKNTMQILSDHFQFHLYTTSETSELSDIVNMGPANTFTEMPLIFHQSKISLNTTSKAIRTGIPLRVFDIIACGGFVLSNYQPEIAEFFQLGSEIDCYGTMDELCEKASYYLEHDALRAEMAEAAYERLISEYTFPIRLSLLLNLAFSI
ncbi:MAG: glycosyltransferase [Lachnospiraceae bacterium]